RARLFDGPTEYAGFLRVLAEGQALHAMRLLAYTLMPNHWHLVLWPTTDRELSDYVGWATLTHTQRCHVYHHTVGSRHLYQGRFQSIPMGEDAHLLTVCRYVERNPVRAGLVARVEEWQWGSAAQRLVAAAEDVPVHCQGPLPRPTDWTTWANGAEDLGRG